MSAEHVYILLCLWLAIETKQGQHFLFQFGEYIYNFLKQAVQNDALLTVLASGDYDASNEDVQKNQEETTIKRTFAYIANVQDYQITRATHQMKVKKQSNKDLFILLFFHVFSNV